MLSPVFLVMSARNGSQMVFRLAVVSVEMIPKLTSSAAPAGTAASITAIDAAISERSMSSLLACLAHSSHLLPAEPIGPEEDAAGITPGRQRRRQRPARWFRRLQCHA